MAVRYLALLLGVFLLGSALYVSTVHACVHSVMQGVPSQGLSSSSNIVSNLDEATIAPLGVLLIAGVAVGVAALSRLRGRSQFSRF